LVKLRLQRHGRKKRPYYHIVAADVRTKRDGRLIEDLGRYNPVVHPKLISINTERVIYWLQNGAIPSETVKSLLKKEGVYYRLHLMRWNKSEEEIEQTISEWKASKSDDSALSPTQLKRAALKAEQEAVRKEQEAAAKEAAEQAAIAKAEAEAKAQQEADAAAASEETETAAEEAAEEKTEE
jgi:small subunit ribosomal protein S16